MHKNVLDTNNIFIINLLSGYNYVTETSIMQIANIQFCAKLKHQTRLSLKNGIRQSWFHSYVSGSDYNQIHTHLLLYYVCLAVQFTDTSWNFNGRHSKVNIFIIIKVS